MGFPYTSAEAMGEVVSGLLKELRRATQLTYVRFYSLKPTSAAAARSLSQVCRRPHYNINSGYSLRMDLSGTVEELQAALTSNHQRNIRLSLSEAIEWKFGHSNDLAEDLSLVYQEMTRVKNVEATLFHLASLGALRRHFGANCILFVGYHDGQPVTGCLVLIIAGKAFYLMAATRAEGRRLRAAYGMVFKLLEFLKTKGAVYFDFCGLDPASPKSSGVDYFKRGFGGKVVEYLGEWEWASSPWLRWGVNLAIRCRRGLL